MIYLKSYKLYKESVYDSFGDIVKQVLVDLDDRNIKYRKVGEITGIDPFTYSNKDYLTSEEVMEIASECISNNLTFKMNYISIESSIDDDILETLQTANEYLKTKGYLFYGMSTSDGEYYKNLTKVSDYSVNLYYKKV